MVQETFSVLSASELKCFMVVLLRNNFMIMSATGVKITKLDLYDAFKNKKNTIATGPKLFFFK